jgi:acyl carrier protein
MYRQQRAQDHARWFAACRQREERLGGRPQTTSEADMTTNDAGEVDATVRAVLADVLGIAPERVARFDESTPLFGALPELDSMAVAGLLTELEDRLGIRIDDEEIGGDLLGTFGALLTFARSKTLG